VRITDLFSALMKNEFEKIKDEEGGSDV